MGLDRVETCINLLNLTPGLIFPVDQRDSVGLVGHPIPSSVHVVSDVVDQILKNASSCFSC